MVYAERDVLIDPASLPAASAVQLLAGWLWPLNYLLFCLILLLFPDGRLPSPRWRPAARFILAAQALSTLLNALVPGEGNPLSVPALQQPAGQQLALAVNAAALVGLVTSAAAPFLRFRRAGYRQRQQLKWIAFTVAASVIMVLAGIALEQLFPGGALIVGLIGGLGLLGVVVGIPVAVAVAILRHRLYDIDRLINRTAVYGLLTALLGLVYAGGVFALGGLLDPADGQSELAVAASTLAVAALFQPARRRVQAAVDRRFARRRYNAGKTVEAFSGRLRDQIDLDTLSVELLVTVNQTMQPSAVSLWLRPSPQAPSPTKGRAS